MTAFPPPIGEPPAVQFFAPDRLSVDHAYQRQLESRASQKLVFGIAQAWDWRLCVPLLVSERPEGLFILDGQHRWAAAKLRGDIPFLPCAVGRFGSIGEEALLFVAANRKRVQVSRIDLFRAAVAAGHEEEVKVADLVAAAGLSIAPHVNPRHYGPGQLGCTATLLAILKRSSAARLRDTLAVISTAFAGEVIEGGSTILLAVHWMLTRDAPLPIERLVQALRMKTPREWVARPELRDFSSGEGRAQQLGRLVIARASRPEAEPRPTSGKPPRSFEEQLDRVSRGEAGIGPAFHPSKPQDQTLGGIASAML